jgi:tetratricopeptide (TPR) repeat protein
MAKRKKSARGEPQALSPGRRRVFVGITIALPLLLIVALELILRLFGWGGYPAWIREIGLLPSGGSLCMVEPAAANPYFFANPEHRGGSTTQTTFVMPKPPNTVRIFLVGESAAQGYPQPRNLALSSFLQAMLSDAWPEKKVEVINLGTTAVASFPLVYQVRDALKFDPDLFIFYTGNNEFFGAYGTASTNDSGALPPWALRLMRAARGLAVMQMIDRWVYRGADADRTLMETMIGRTVIPADSPLREAAARNLAVNLGTMLDDVRAAGVPAIVCTTASNESGLAPLGEDDVTGLDEKQQLELRRIFGQASDASDRGDFAAAVALLGEAGQLAPRHARAHFLLGQALARAGQPEAARANFLKARDLDTLPWRPISLTEKAVRDTALGRGSVLCDTAEIFREQSPDGATGWELLDDHVHLSLSGQAWAARTMVDAMSALAPPLRVGAAEASRLRDDSTYAHALGTNLYDTYAVDHSLRLLFSVPFFKKSNGAAYDSLTARCREAEEQMPPSFLAAVREWQNFPAEVAVLRPVTSLVGFALLREGRVREAIEFYGLAARQIPDYTSWYLEYVYYAMACRQQLDGHLNAQDLATAAEAVAQGRFILDHRLSNGGAAENFYVGRLYQLRGEWSEAVPFLLAARLLLKDQDRFATDQALSISYLQTARKAEALAVADDGIKSGGPLADAYRRLRSDLENGTIVPVE